MNNVLKQVVCLGCGFCNNSKQANITSGNSMVLIACLDKYIQDRSEQNRANMLKARTVKRVSIPTYQWLPAPLVVWFRLAYQS